MAKIDWVGLVASLLQEGVKALVPGSGLVVGPAGQAAGPSLDRLRTWREDKLEQKEFAADVVEWAHRYKFGDADADLGLVEAARIVRQCGADWVLIAERNFDAGAVAEEVLRCGRDADKAVDSPARQVSEYAVSRFYQRMIDKAGLRELTAASLPELLRRTAELEERFAELRNFLAEQSALRNQESHEARHQQLLERVSEGISALEGAESAYRSLTQPRPEGIDPQSLRESRAQLVAARVALEGLAHRLPEEHLRSRVLGFVAADEQEDRDLRSGVDLERFEATRAATIAAYQGALVAIGEAQRAAPSGPSS
jgi:hypothetical protein